MATIPKAVFSFRGYNIIIYIVAHNSQFYMQHRACFCLHVAIKSIWQGKVLMDPFYTMAMASSLTLYKATESVFSGTIAILLTAHAFKIFNHCSNKAKR